MQNTILSGGDNNNIKLEALGERRPPPSGAVAGAGAKLLLSETLTTERESLRWWWWLEANNVQPLRYYDAYISESGLNVTCVKHSLSFNVL